MPELKKNLTCQKKNYTYKESKTTTKKISGVYDTATHTIESEADKRDILKELEDFEGAVIEVSIVVKEETDLSNENQKVGGRNIYL